jgi:PAS domain S-box-containing protein
MMMTRWFYAFIVGNLIIAVFICVALVSISAESSIFLLLKTTREAQAQQASIRFEEFLRNRVTLLEDLSQRPLLANVVMGSESSENDLDDYMLDYTLLGKKEPIFLIDIFGNTIRSFHHEGKDLPFETSAWLDAILEGREPAAILLEQYEGTSVFAIAVPITYGQFPEGALVAIVTESALSILPIHDLDGATYEIASPYFSYSNHEGAGDYHVISEKTIGDTGVKLSYQVSEASISERKLSFMIDIGIGICMSLIVAFFLLGIVGRQFFLNPYLKLESSRRKINEAKQHNDLLVAAIDASPIGISISDGLVHGAPINYVNSAFESITGYTATEIIGKNCRFLAGEETSLEDSRQISEALSAGKKVELEILNYRKDGVPFWNLLKISPVFSEEHQIIAFVGIQQDITNKKAFENDLLLAKDSAEAAAIAKGQFLANMSHEIRTPINGVMGMLALVLKSTTIQPQERQRLDIARSSADSLLTIINDILDFSKIEAGELVIESIEFDVRKLLSDSSRAMAFHAQQKGLHLVLDASDLKRQFFRGDANRIRQVLGNLVSNATKFTEQGEIVIKASVRDIAGDQSLLTCSVQDSGVGITPGNLKQVFEPFKQADASTTREFGGTGLGLSIVKQLCTLMHGTTKVSSQLGVGSNFEVSFQLQHSARDNVRIDAMSPSAQSVLLVEEHSTSRLTIEKQLRLWVKNVYSVSNCEEAKTLFSSLDESDVPEIAFISADDVDGAGIQLCAWLQHHSLPIKLITMRTIASEWDAEELTARGIHKNLLKPATPSDLFDAINLISTTQPEIHIQQSFFAEDLRILIVEDNAINQEIILGMLEDLGLTADCATNGIVALEMLNAQHDARYDIVLMDCQMPELDGYQTTSAIRDGQGGSQYIDVPIVAMTANAMSGDQQKCLDAGMDDYMSKPIDGDLLKDKLMRFSANA